MSGRLTNATTLTAMAIMACVTGPVLAIDDLSLNVDAGSVCVSTGQTVTVTLDVANLSAAVNGVQVLLQYDNTLMTLIDIVPTDLGLAPPAAGWAEISQTDSFGSVDWSAVINGGSIGINHTIATLTFTAIANGTAGVTFRADAPPIITKLTRASNSTTILPTVFDSGGVFIGPPVCTLTGENAVCDGTSAHVVTVPDAGIGATYAWTVTGGTIDSGQGTTSISYTAVNPTTVTIDVIVTDPNGCTSSCQKIVTVNANPDCTITAAASVCANSSGNPATVPNAGVGATYVWTVTGGSIDSGQGTDTLAFSAGVGPNVTVDVTVTDANGCVSSCQNIIAVAAPDCTITAANAVCDGSTGNAVTVPDAGVGATYTWTITGGTIEGLPPFGSAITYTAGAGLNVTIDVTVVGGAGCQSSCQKIVAVDANPDATITTAAAVCDGSAGNAASVLDAGVGATYSWTVTGGTIAGLPPFGSSITYTAGAGPTVTIDVIVTDANACSSSSQSIVTVSANPNAAITTAAAVCDGSTLNAASVVDAGLGATYAWTVTGGTIDGIPPFGSAITYTAGVGPTVTIDVTVTDGSGCVSSSQTVVTVNVNPNAAITGANQVCDGSTLNAASVVDAGIGATYAWTVTGGTIDGIPPFGNAITYTATSPTSVTIDVTVTDGNGCVSNGQSIVTVNANPACTITGAAAVCDSSTGNIASTTDLGVGTTYAWTVTGGTLTSGQNTASITYTAGSGINVVLDLTVTEASGCVSVCQSIITINPNPNAAITSAAAVCDGTTGNAASVANAGVGATYAWTVTGGTIEDIPPFTSSITYTAGAGPTVTIDVTVTDANGCVSTSQNVVTVNPNPNATITTSTAVCDGTIGNAASVLDAGVGSTYAWTVTGGTIEDIPPFTNAITYTAGVGPTVTIDVTVTDPNGCVSTSQNIVTVNANPDATITASAAVCDGTAGNAASVPDAGVGATYTWTVTGGTINDIPPFTSAITYTAGAGPTVTIDVTVTDGNGCVSSSQLVVSVNANPTCIITADAAVCAGTSGLNATASDAGIGATYVWSVTGGTLDAGQGTTAISYTAGVGATVTLDVTMTDANGCVSSCQTIVTVNANPDCTISANNLACEGSTGNVASVPNAGLGATYLWTITGGALNSGQGTTAISYTAGFGTSLTISVTVTDANGCVSTCQKIVTVDAPDCTISGANSVCFQSVGNFATVPDSGVGSTYAWTVTGGTLSTGQGTNSITYSAGAGATVTLDITVTNPNGCVRSCQKIVTIIQPSLDVTLQLEAVSSVVTRAVTFVITDCGGTTDTRTLPVTTNLSGVGNVIVPNVSPNANWVSVKEGHTLSKLASVLFGTCSVATINLTAGNLLLAGDFQSGVVVQDNLCDITDFSILASRWNTAIDPNLTDGADATGDGTQDTADFTAIQVNFFVQGEAVNACPAALDSGGLTPVGGGVVVRNPVRTIAKASVRVENLSLVNASAADLTGDGVVDAQDIRAFARRNGLELIPEFDRRLTKLEGRAGRGKRRR